MAQSANTILAKTFLAFNQMGKNVVFESKRNLATKRRRKMGSGRFVTSKIDNTGALSNSLKFFSSGTSSYFQMNQYGLYVDEGRKKGKFAPVTAMQLWVKEKPVLPRDERGRFMPRNKSSMKSLAFLLNRAIFKYGIQPTNFFSDPLEEQTKKLIEKLPDAIEADITTYFSNR